MTATGAAAMLLLGQSAQANVLVATIVGAYDAVCGSCSLENGSTIKNYAGNEGGDTPSLFFLNPTSQSFKSVTITLTGYQDAAGGAASAGVYTPGKTTASTETFTVSNIAPNTVYQLAWGVNSVGVTNGPTGNNLFANDYDDEFGNAVPYPGPRSGVGGATPDPSGHECGEAGSGAPTSICAFVGNFDVDFEAQWFNGTKTVNISSVFGETSISDKYVGWEGLDPDGLSETQFDNHSGTFPGTLANIFTGTHVAGGGTLVPEPSSLALLGAGLGALGLARRRRKAKSA